MNLFLARDTPVLLTIFLGPSNLQVNFLMKVLIAYNLSQYLVDLSREGGNCTEIGVPIPTSTPIPISTPTPTPTPTPRPSTTPTYPYAYPYTGNNDTGAWMELTDFNHLGVLCCLLSSLFLLHSETSGFLDLTFLICCSG